MATKTNFLTGGSYLASDLQNEFNSMCASGVFNVVSGALLVTALSTANLSVNVAIGSCMMNGLYNNNTAIANVLITSNSSGYGRIDVIAMDLDNNVMIAVAGTPSSAPTAPILTLDKVALAQVAVGNNVSVINTVNISDVRAECGKASILQPTPIAPTFLNGWSNYGYTYDLLHYWMDSLGYVHIQGSVSSGTSVTNIFKLPVGYAPLYDKFFPCDANAVYGSIDIIGVNSGANAGNVVGNYGGTRLGINVSFRVGV